MTAADEAIPSPNKKKATRLSTPICSDRLQRRFLPSAKDDRHAPVLVVAVGVVCSVVDTPTLGAHRGGARHQARESQHVLQLPVRGLRALAIQNVAVPEIDERARRGQLIPRPLDPDP